MRHESCLRSKPHQQFLKDFPLGSMSYKIEMWMVPLSVTSGLSHGASQRRAKIWMKREWSGRIFPRNCYQRSAKAWTPESILFDSAVSATRGAPLFPPTTLLDSLSNSLTLTCPLQQLKLKLRLISAKALSIEYKD